MLLLHVCTPLITSTTGLLGGKHTDTESTRVDCGKNSGIVHVQCVPVCVRLRVFNIILYVLWYRYWLMTSNVHVAGHVYYAVPTLTLYITSAD